MKYFLFVFILLGCDPPAEPPVPFDAIPKVVIEEEKPASVWHESHEFGPSMAVRCEGVADCKARAIQAYTFARETFEKRNVDVVNLYTAYLELRKVKAFIAHGNVPTSTPELEGLDVLHDQARRLIKQKMDELRDQYESYEEKKNYVKMAETLNQMQAYFPDKHAGANRWAVEQEQEMKKQKIYPANFE